MRLSVADCGSRFACSVLARYHNCRSQRSRYSARQGEGEVQHLRYITNIVKLATIFGPHLVSR